MQVIFHSGAHFTEEDRLLKCLLRNKEGFSADGIAVPGPGKYRELLKEAFAAMRHAPPSDQARDVLIDTILDDETANRMILSNPHFFGSARFSIVDGDFYPQAPERMAHLHQLFPEDDIELFMCIRAPVTFLSALVEPAPETRLGDVLGGANPLDMRWSDLFHRVRERLPDLPITVWCFEDAPLIWGRVMREMAGIPTDRKFSGAFDLLASLVTRDGMREFRAAMHEAGRGPVSPDLIAETILAHGVDEALEQELHLPGWPAELIEDMQWAYEEDLELVAAIPGLRLIEP